MNIAEKSLKELFPDKERIITLKYSKRFSPYNGSVTYTVNTIKLAFSHLWKDVSEDIQIGLAQYLLLKVFRTKKRTLNIELYEKFMENITKYVRSDKSDPELEESFNRVNEEYFHNFMEQPGLEWGNESTTQLGTFSYHTDTIRISAIFQDSDWALDYVMYHEMLHKQLGLKHKGGSCRHHPPEFRRLEKQFKVENAEKKLNSFVNLARRGKIQPSIVKKIRNIFK